MAFAVRSGNTFATMPKVRPIKTRFALAALLLTPLAALLAAD